VSVGEVAFECISVSPNHEAIVACTKSQEMLCLSMNAIETVQEDRVDYKELLRNVSIWCRVDPTSCLMLCVLM
jgi:hypothetical protein